MVPAFAQDRTAAIGKQRAAGSRLVWDLSDGAHPRMGPLRFAFLREPVITPVGSDQVSSRAFFSCERNGNTIAIELANATAPDDPSGLRPKAMPRLVCSRLMPNGNLVQREIDAKWQVNEIGDALVRGLRPSQLRECVSIGVLQEVALPRGWEKQWARVEFDLMTYGRELDSIFYTCGEPSAYAVAAAPSPARNPVALAPTPVAATTAPSASTTPATASPPSAATPPAAATTPATAPVSPPPAPAPKVAVAPKQAAAAPASSPWRMARTVASGRTTLRSRPSTDAPMSAQLPPDVSVLVQPVGSDWWHVKSPGGRAHFEGYIRADRLVLK